MLEFSRIAGFATGARVLLGADATEAAIKAVRGPRLLHLATHGFFLPDQEALHSPPADPLLHGFGTLGSPRAPGLRIENPLLRSGLALAGANARRSGTEDGLLTALEASQLDLYGTRLVVLSACETGLGDVRAGDGVYGLRRAFVMAGAETQVMSLWRIDDAVTRNLMLAYYDQLAQGGGRSEAMRQQQLALLARPETAHPYYWAPFIVSGNGAALDGRRVVPSFIKVTPGPHGCGCELAPRPEEAGFDRRGLLLAAVALAARQRRRWPRSK